MEIGIEDLERLNALSKEFSKPDMDLEELKLVVSFLDNGEQRPVHSFKDDEITFMHRFLRAPEKDGRNYEESEKV
jgi:hypothetical protein